MRRLLLAVLVLGMSGTFVELLLLSHYEDVYQLLPIGLIGLTLGMTVWHVARPNRHSVRALRGAMILFIIAAAAGIGFHFYGAAAFQLEIDPSQGWLQLAGKVIRSHAPPLLAPGGMLQLGLIGLIYTHRHPGNTGAERLHEKAGTRS